MSTTESSATGAPDPTTSAPAPPKPKRFGLSIYQEGRELDPDFVANVRQLEAHFKRRVLVMIDAWASRAFYPSTHFQLRYHKSQLGSEPIAVLLERYGGIARLAYKTASMIRRTCGAYSVIVPDVALSAATLFCLGADMIYLGDDATLGPLDAQVQDDDVEEDVVSALDTVQAVEQLEDSAIEVGWKMLRYLHDRRACKDFCVSSSGWAQGSCIGNRPSKRMAK